MFIILRIRGRQLLLLDVVVTYYRCITKTCPAHARREIDDRVIYSMRRPPRRDDGSELESVESHSETLAKRMVFTDPSPPIASGRVDMDVCAAVAKSWPVPALATCRLSFISSAASNFLLSPREFLHVRASDAMTRSSSLSVRAGLGNDVDCDAYDRHATPSRLPPPGDARVILRAGFVVTVMRRGKRYWKGVQRDMHTR